MSKLLLMNTTLKLKYSRWSDLLTDGDFLINGLYYLLVLNGYNKTMPRHRMEQLYKHIHGDNLRWRISSHYGRGLKNMKRQENIMKVCGTIMLYHNGLRMSPFCYDHGTKTYLDLPEQYFYFEMVDQLDRYRKHMFCTKFLSFENWQRWARMAKDNGPIIENQFVISVNEMIVKAFQVPCNNSHATTLRRPPDSCFHVLQADHLWTLIPQVVSNGKKYGFEHFFRLGRRASS